MGSSKTRPTILAVMSATYSKTYDGGKNRLLYGNRLRPATIDGADLTIGGLRISVPPPVGDRTNLYVGSLGASLARSRRQWLRTFRVRYVELGFTCSALMSHSATAMTTSVAATRSPSVDEMTASSTSAADGPRAPT